MLRSGFAHAGRIAPVAVAALLVCAGCSAPAYDENTDKAIGALQNDLDTELITLASQGERVETLKSQNGASAQKALSDALAKASFDAHMPAYDKIEADLTTVQLRVDAAPNDSTPELDKALGALNANIFGAGTLKETHRREDVLSSGYAKAQKAILDQQLEALLTYELVLKNGTASSSKSGQGGN